MNWPRIILDGLAMSTLFNAVAGLGFLLVPQAYSTMFPKEIKEAASPYVRKEDVRTMKLILYPLYLVLFVWWAFSARFAGISGFWNLFWTGYVEMTMVSVTDFILLDCWLPQKIRHRIKGWRSRSTGCSGRSSSARSRGCSSRESTCFWGDGYEIHRNACGHVVAVRWFLQSPAYQDAWL